MFFRPKKNIALPKKKKKVETVTTAKKTKSSLKGEKTNAPPNKILFVTNLPEETNSQMLRLVFQP